MIVSHVRYLLGACSLCWRPARFESSSCDTDHPDETLVKWRSCRRHQWVSLERLRAEGSDRD